MTLLVLSPIIASPHQFEACIEALVSGMLLQCIGEMLACHELMVAQSLCTLLSVDVNRRAHPGHRLSEPCRRCFPALSGNRSDHRPSNDR